MLEFITLISSEKPIFLENNCCPIPLIAEVILKFKSNIKERIEKEKFIHKAHNMSLIRKLKGDSVRE